MPSFKKIAAMLITIFLSMFAITAAAAATTSTDEYVEAKLLINQNISCQQSSPDQLAAIGDYYMEQMMPGQAHKNMEQILGGEGSDSLKQAHIFMARRWYCGDAAGLGMMGMMTGGNWNVVGNSNYPYRMMSGNFNSFGYGNYFPNGMMGNYFGSNWNNGYGMMGGTYSWGGGLFMLVGIILFAVAIAALIKYLLKK